MKEETTDRSRDIDNNYCNVCPLQYFVTELIICELLSVIIEADFA